MANSIYSTDQQIWKDFVDENWGVISSLIAQRVRNSSQLEVVGTLTEFHTILLNYSHGGVSKVQRTTIETFIKELDTDIEELIARVEAFLAQAQENEQVRIDNETVRQTDEATRESHEATRESNETGRVTAENARVSQWTSWFTNGVTVDWANWFSDTLATGVRKIWNDWYASVQAAWTGFWGTSATDPNGVRKQWADLEDRANSDHSQAVSDSQQAAADHTQAGQDHSVAVADHQTATADHSTSVTDSGYAREQGDYSKNMADHPAYIGDDNYWYHWDYVTQAYVKDAYAKGDDLHWEEMSEQEKDDLANRVTQTLVFATVADTQAAMNELT